MLAVHLLLTVAMGLPLEFVVVVVRLVVTPATLEFFGAHARTVLVAALAFLAVMMVVAHVAPPVLVVMRALRGVTTNIVKGSSLLGLRGCYIRCTVRISDLVSGQGGAQTRKTDVS